MNTISTSSALRSHSAPLRYTTQQIRHASLIRRPKRPYTFTQLVTLSDGSTFTHRTTSPQAVYRTTKDTKNNPLWNPSSQKLLNVEEDEAGRLRRFRARFGRGFDAEAKEVSPEEGEAAEAKQEEQEENLMDLISSYGAASAEQTSKKEAAPAKAAKGKGGKK